MIISHKHRFIFIKTHKTAGSSIETLLSRLCGPDDIVTTMDPPAEGHSPRNWIGNSPIDRLYRRYRRARKIIHRDSLFLYKHYYQHMGAERVRKLCGEAVWRDYFKFCFERNPWDKVVSFYWWKMREKPDKEPFSEWLRYKKLPVDSELYSIDGEPAVDFIGRFEHLQDHLAQALEQIGLPGRVELPRVKVGIRKEKRSYTDYYNEDDRLFVQSLFASEIELLDYPYGSAAPDSAWQRR